MAHVVAGDALVRLTTPGGPNGAEGRRAGAWYDPGHGIDVALVAGEHRLAPFAALPRLRRITLHGADPASLRNADARPDVTVEC